MNNLKLNAFYEIISTGMVAQLVNITGTIASCVFHGQSTPFIMAVNDLKYLGDSYKPLTPKAINLFQLIKDRNQEIHDYTRSKIKKSKDPQLDLCRLILITPKEDLEDLLISRGLKEPITVEDGE